LLPFAILAGWHWNWGAPGGYGDHAQYLAHARALVEGRSYTDIGYIYHPAAPMIGPRAYPPGLPLTLVPIVALAGVNSPWNQVLMLVSLLLFALFAYRRLELMVAPWQAALAAGLTAIAIEGRFGTLVPMSDVGFGALLWAAILAIDTTATWTWKRIAIITSLGFGAMAYRIPGAVLIPALALYAIATWRQHRGRALIPVAIWGITGAVVLASGLFDLPFRGQLLPHLPEIGNRIRSLVRVYQPAVFDAELYPFVSGRLNDAYHAVASVAALGGSAALLWRYRRTMLTATVVMYTAMLFAAPVNDGRYLWPLYPVIACGMVIGVVLACRIAARLFLRRDVRAALPAALALSLVFIGSVWHESKTPRPRSLDHLPDAASLFEWLRARQVRAPMRVMFYNPRVLTLKTRVPAMGAIVRPPPFLLSAIYENQITHIVWQSAEARSCRSALVNALPALYPDRFAVEYGNETFRVYRVLRSDMPLPDNKGRPIGIPKECGGLGT
jgi:hypothetical protein